MYQLVSLLLPDVSTNRGVINIREVTGAVLVQKCEKAGWKMLLETLSRNRNTYFNNFDMGIGQVVLKNNNKIE